LQKMWAGSARRLAFSSPYLVRSLRKWSSSSRPFVSTHSIKNPLCRGGKISFLPITQTYHFEGERKIFPGKFLSTNSEENQKKEVVYEGPLQRGVFLLKTFSLVSLATGIIAAPVLIVFGKATIPLMARIALSLTTASFGALTTGLLNYVSTPYIMKLTRERESGEFSAERVDLFLRRRWSNFRLEDVEPVYSFPYITFKAKGERYFLHKEFLREPTDLVSLLQSDQSDQK